MEVFDSFLNASISIAPVVLVVLVLVIGALVALSLAVVQLGTRLRNLTYPVYDQVVKEAQAKANNMLDEAEEQSRAIRAKAQMEAGKVLSDRKKEDEQLRQQHVQNVEAVTQHAKEILNKQTAAIQQLSEEVASEFKTYSEQARSALNQESSTIKQIASSEVERIKKSFAALEAQTQKEFAALIAANKKQVHDELGREIQGVRDVIAAYKKDRFDLLDQQIISLIEDTARITLNKTLTLEEHHDLIISALAQAKQEGIFGK